MAKNEVALKTSWNLDGSGVIARNQLVGYPRAWCGGAVDKTALRNLEEVEGRFVDFSAITAFAASEIRQDRTMMAFGPWRPLKVDGAAGSYRDVVCGWLGVKMANDVLSLLVSQGTNSSGGTRLSAFGHGRSLSRLCLAMAPL